MLELLSELWLLEDELLLEEGQSSATKPASVVPIVPTVHLLP